MRDLGSRGEIRTGSSPVARTKKYAHKECMEAKQMARRLIIGTTCPICGKQVEAVPDSVLKQQPGTIDAEIVVTRSGYKQYIHSSCWYGMIAKQKERRKEQESNPKKKTDVS